MVSKVLSVLVVAGCLLIASAFSYLYYLHTSISRIHIKKYARERFIA